MTETIVITGTTNGLGHALAIHFLSKGFRVIGLNRRPAKSDPALGANGYEHVVIDIAAVDEVEAFFQLLDRKSIKPTAVILNAGINEVDNAGPFDSTTFEKIMRTNLFGVSTFLGAIQRRGWAGVNIVGISSTSTIVPSPTNVGYSLSKRCLNELFSNLRKTDLQNRYKIVILGPVATQLGRHLPAQTGLRKKLFNALLRSSEDAARAVGEFSLNQRSFLRFSLTSYLVYHFVAAVLRIPNLIMKPASSARSKT